MKIRTVLLVVLVCYLLFRGASGQEGWPDIPPMPTDQIAIAETDNLDDVIVFSDMTAYDPLPTYVYAMPRGEYQRWAKAQNDMGYFDAANRAKAYRDRNPPPSTYVASSGVVIDTVGVMDTSDLTYRAWLDRTYYAGSQAFRVYTPTDWAGGPVVIINPFCKRPPKVMRVGDRFVVCDPDGVLKDRPELAEELLKEYLE
jgi:hypothetical protein